MATLEFIPTADVDQVNVQDNTLSLQPRFFGRGRESEPCAMLVVKDCEGEVVTRFHLVVNGKNLSLKLLDRYRPVMPPIERRRRLLAGQE